MSGASFSKSSVQWLASFVFVAIWMLQPNSVFGQYPNYQQPYNAWHSGYQNYAYGGYGTKIWDDRIMQAQLELSREQRRELLELKLEYDEVMGDLQLKMNQLSAKQYTRGENGATSQTRMSKKRSQKSENESAK